MNEHSGDELLIIALMALVITLAVLWLWQYLA